MAGRQNIKASAYIFSSNQESLIVESTYPETYIKLISRTSHLSSTFNDPVYIASYSNSLAFVQSNVVLGEFHYDSNLEQSVFNTNGVANINKINVNTLNVFNETDYNAPIVINQEDNARFITLNDNTQRWSIIGVQDIQLESSNIRLSLIPNTGNSIFSFKDSASNDVFLIQQSNIDPYLQTLAPLGLYVVPNSNYALDTDHPVRFQNTVNVTGRNAMVASNANVRTIVLKEYNQESDHQYSGFGIVNDDIVYQLPSTFLLGHSFRAASSGNNSVELMRITSDAYNRSVVLIGSPSVTDKTLNVGGDVYISSNVGIGTTIAKKTLDVQGDINFFGSLYQNNSPYISSQWSSNNTSNSLYYLGSVGIGTTDPLATLDVNGIIRGSALTGGLITDSTSTVSSTIAASATAVKTAYDMAIGVSNFSSNYVLKSGDTMTGNLIVNANLGIGTGTPLYPLHVQGEAYITSNLGIGTTVAKKTLDVQGDINFSGSLYQNNSLYISSQWTSNNTTNSLYYLGSVGIGTTQPRSALDVSGTISSTNLVINNSIITSNLTVLGTETIVNTYTTYTSNLRIDNQQGDGSALVVLQKGLGQQYAVADFYDRDVSITVPALRVADGGNVGIGTAIPLQSLHVQGNIYSSGSIGIGSTQPTVALDVAGTIRGTALTGGLITDSITTISSTIAASATAVKSAFDNGSNAILNTNSRVLKAGDTMTGNLIVNANIGINTATPLQPLHVQGLAYISSNLGIGLAGSNAFQPLTVYGQAYISSNVGIGTTQPNYYLDVYGTGRIHGNSFLGDSWSFNQHQVLGRMFVNATSTTLPVFSATQQSGAGNVADFYDGTLPALIVRKGGNIGIGTTNPSHKLHIYSVSATDNDYESAGILLENATAGETAIAFRNSNVNAGSNVWFMGLNSNSSRFDIGYGTQSTQLADASVNMSINTSGNVGIGTTLAKKTLDIQGDINFTGSLYQNNNLYISSQWTSNNVTNSLYYNGSVGIGSTQPISALDVAGTIRGTALTGGLITDSTSTISSNIAASATAVKAAFDNGSNAILNANSRVLKAGDTMTGNLIVNANIGINTTTPLQPLHVQGLAYISSNVGIGTTLAKKTLDVQGDINFAGSLYQNNNLYISSQWTSNNVTNSLYYLGSVGIGSTQPTVALDVVGTIRATNLAINNSIITSNLTVLGTETIVNTYTTYSSNLVIDNQLGTGPALLVLQKGFGQQYAIADFYDRDISTTVPALRVADGGIVGIGTATPLQKLHVQGNTYISSNLGIGSTQPVTALDVVGTIRGTALTGGLITDSTSIISSNIAASATAVKLAFDNGSNAILNANSRVLKAGDTMTGNLIVNANIGINTATPLQPLHVQGLAYISSNVGIGTTFAKKTLDVQGDINFAGSLYQNNNLYISSQWTSNNVTNSLYYNGSVGIGSTQPISALDVVGTIRGTALTGGLITDSTSIISSNIAASATAVKLAFDNGSNAILNANSRVLKAGDTMTGNLIVNANIGINTATPLQPLHVQGLAYISSNVGIGTTLAKKTLDVQGDINFAGSLYQNNNLYISSQWTSNNVTNSLYYNGSVGIGSTQPVTALDVVGTIRGTALTGGLITDSTSIISSNIAASATAVKLAFDNGSNAIINANSRVLRAGDTMTGNLIVNANIGINTTTPIQPLHVQGLAYISSNVGIGTTFAKKTLDVQGDINFAGSLYQNNNLYISSQWTSNNVTNSLYYNGSVGIGSTQPVTALDVVGTIRGTNLAINNSIITSNLTVLGTETIVNTYTTYSSNLVIDNQLGTGPALLVLQKGIGNQYPIADFYDRDVSTTVPALRIADGGYIGIGTATPVQPLHIQGNTYISSNVGIGTTNPVTRIDITTASGYTGDVLRVSPLPSNSYDMKLNVYSPAGGQVNYRFYTKNQNITYDNVLVFENSNIGISTARPRKELDVVGTALVSGSVGIGTTLPNHKLHIYSTSIIDNNYESTGILLDNATAGEVGIGFRNSNLGTNTWVMGINSNSTRLDITYGPQVTQISTGDVKLSLDTSGTLTTSNLIVLGQVALAPGALNTNIQVKPTRQTFYVSDTTQSAFNVLVNGLYGGEASNVQVYLGQKLLTYYTSTYKDYDLSLDYPTSNITQYTINLTNPAIYGDFVDITVWPQLLPSSSYTGSVYQSITFSNLPTYNTNYIYDNFFIRGTIGNIYTTSNVGIGTTLPKTLFHVQGSAYITSNLGIGFAGSNTVQPLTVYGQAYISSNVGIGTTRPLQTLHVQGNSLMGSGTNGTDITTGGGPFFKQNSWDIVGTTHTISYPTYCQGDNSAGTISIQVSNKVNNSVSSKIGNLMVSFIKQYNTNVALFTICNHKSTTLSTLTVGTSTNDIVITTDSDCSISWTSTGSY